MNYIYKYTSLPQTEHGNYKIYYDPLEEKVTSQSHCFEKHCTTRTNDKPGNVIVSHHKTISGTRYENVQKYQKHKGKMNCEGTNKWVALDAKLSRSKFCLGHDQGAGKPCLKCGDKCPGFALHYWRKVCRNCRCTKSDHSLTDSEHDLLIGTRDTLMPQPKKVVNLYLLKNESSTEVKKSVAMDWVPPNVPEEVVEKYVQKIPIEKLPISGSQGAIYRQKQIEAQVPSHDFNPDRCDDLSVKEVESLQDYAANIKQKIVGQGVVKLSPGNRLIISRDGRETNIYSIEPLDKDVVGKASLESCSLCKPGKDGSKQKSGTGGCIHPTNKPYKQGTNNQEALRGIDNKYVESKVAYSIPTQVSSTEKPADNLNARQYAQPLTCQASVTSDRQNQLQCGVRAQTGQPSTTIRYPEGFCIGTQTSKHTEDVNTPRNSMGSQTTPSLFALPSKHGSSEKAHDCFQPEHQCSEMDTAELATAHPSLHKLYDRSRDPNITGADFTTPSTSCTSPFSSSTIKAIPDGKGEKAAKGSSKYTTVDPQKINIWQELLWEVRNHDKKQLKADTKYKEFENGAKENAKMIMPLFHGDNVPVGEKLNCTESRRDPNYPNFELGGGEMPQQCQQNVQVYRWLQDLDSISPQVLNSRNDSLRLPGVDAKAANSAPAMYTPPSMNHDVIANYAHVNYDFNPTEVLETNASFPGDGRKDIHAREAEGKAGNEEIVLEEDEVCYECSVPVERGSAGVYVDKPGINGVWHPQCFVCSQCKELLVDLLYFYYKGRIYCGRHVAEAMKIPRCYACDELIFVSTYTAAAGQTYHVKHFCCYECDEPLAGYQYVEIESNPFCMKCYSVKFGKRCGTCKEMIAATDQRVSLKENHWHANTKCFRCFACKNSLLGTRFVLVKNEPYCNKECATPLP